MVPGSTQQNRGDDQSGGGEPDQHHIGNEEHKSAQQQPDPRAPVNAAQRQQQVEADDPYADRQRHCPPQEQQHDGRRDEDEGMVVGGKDQVLAVQARTARIPAAAPKVDELQQQREGRQQDEQRVRRVAQHPSPSCSALSLRLRLLKRFHRFCSASDPNASSPICTLKPLSGERYLASSGVSARTSKISIGPTSSRVTAKNISVANRYRRAGRMYRRRRPA